MAQRSAIAKRRRWTFQVSEKDSTPIGPTRALRQAVELLAPFERVPDPRDKPLGLTEETKSFSPKEWAEGQIFALAVALNTDLYLARKSPRPQEMIEAMQRLQRLLLAADQELGLLGDSERLYVQNAAERLKIANSIFPSVQDGDRGRLAAMCAEAAKACEAAGEELKSQFGESDRGGRQSHYERYHGSAKLNFVRRSFDLFESYRPGGATSTEGSEFHRFVHLVFEYATNVHDEDRAALSHLLRSIITPMREYRSADQEYWLNHYRLKHVEEFSAEYWNLNARQMELDAIKRKLEPVFSPLLQRAGPRSTRVNKA